MELAAPRAGGSSCSSVILHAATLEAQVCVARPPFAPPVQKIGPLTLYQVTQASLEPPAGYRAGGHSA